MLIAFTSKVALIFSSVNFKISYPETIPALLKSAQTGPNSLRILLAAYEIWLGSVMEH